MQVFAEARWFWQGSAQNRFTRWFTSSSSFALAAHGPEVRQDRYFCSGSQTNVGIKSRGTKAGIQVKSLIGTERPGLALEPMFGAIEIWIKQRAPRIELPAGQVVELTKLRWTRKFECDRAGAREIELCPGIQAAGKSSSVAVACKAELALVVLHDGASWWSFGLQAGGSAADAKSAVRATASLLHDLGAPDMDDAIALSYPAWLRRQVVKRVATERSLRLAAPAYPAGMGLRANAAGASVLATTVS